jgi:peptidoglycan/LPS O-acetylase OafA/YrhL
MLIAHFTPAELPGTVAVLIIGVALGLALRGERRRARLAAVAAATGFVAFAVVGFAADALHWPEGTRQAIDLSVLVVALAVAAALWFLPRREPGD